MAKDQDHQSTLPSNLKPLSEIIIRHKEHVFLGTKLFLVRVEILPSKKMLLEE